MNIGFTPVNQVRLTNVAYVRLQKKGRRFEIACYRNKVLNWRNKIETDLSEVLQIDTVFTNVSKGNLASSKDLIEAFGTSDQKLVCKEILDKGDLQVSEQERGALYESVYRDVASIVADKTVNSDTGRPYTISMIQNAMKQIQYSVSVSKNSKSQALDVIRKLRDIMPIVRANMQLRIICSANEMADIRNELLALGAALVTDSTSTATSNGDNATTASLEIRVDPESFRRVEEIVSEKAGGTGRVEVVQLRVANSYATSSSSAAPVQANALAPTQHESSIAATSTEGTSIARESPHVQSKGSSSDTGSALLRRETKSKQRAAAMEHMLLSGATHRTSDDDDDDDDDLEAIGIARKEKKKVRGGRTVPARPTAIELVEDSHGTDDDSSEGEADEDLQLATALSASMSVSTQDGVSVQGAKGGTKNSSSVSKKGKKSRRAEKEEQRDREAKAIAVRQRAVAQQQKQQQHTQEESTNHVFAGIASATVATPAASVAALVAGTGDQKVQSCNTCGGAFHDPKDYRNHFKSEWHRHNLSRKMKGLSLVQSEEAFLALSLEELAAV